MSDQPTQENPDVWHPWLSEQGQRRMVESIIRGSDLADNATPGSPDSPRYSWTDKFGQRWECDAYDHGPFCRQCRAIPEPETIEEAIGENLRLGYLELIGVNDQGEPTYKLTSAGEARVRNLLNEPDVES